MGCIDAAAEEAIARLAAANDELIARWSLLNEGVRPAAIDDRVRSGRLRVVHPGVYFAGHGEPSRLQSHRAAQLACGDGAVLRRATACELWRMLSAHPGPSEVLVHGPRRRGPAGIALARTSHLPAEEVTVHRGIPVTTPARTLLDLAAAHHPGLELAHQEAHALGLIREAEIEALARSGRRGAAPLRALLAEAPGYTRGGAERLLRVLLLKAQLPVPAFNATLLGRRRDAVWFEQRVVLEVDGFAGHGTQRCVPRRPPSRPGGRRGRLPAASRDLGAADGRATGARRPAGRGARPRRASRGVGPRRAAPIRRPDRRARLARRRDTSPPAFDLIRRAGGPAGSERRGPRPPRGAAVDRPLADPPGTRRRSWTAARPRATSTR